MMSREYEPNQRLATRQHMEEKTAAQKTVASRFNVCNKYYYAYMYVSNTKSPSLYTHHNEQSYAKSVYI